MTEQPWQRKSVDMTEFIKHLTDPAGRGEANYLEVKYRLVLLRKIAPEASIETTLLFFHPTTGSETRQIKRRSGSTYPKEVQLGGYAVYKARVSLPDGTVGEGHKHETSEDFTDFAEKAETGAIGRAIAAAGIGVQYSNEDYEYERDSTAHFTGVQGDAPPSLKGSARARKEPAAVPAVAAATQDDPPANVTPIGRESHTPHPMDVERATTYSLEQLALAADGPSLLATWAKIEKANLANDATIHEFLHRSASFKILESSWARINRAKLNTPELGSLVAQLKKDFPQGRRQAAS